MSQAHATGRRRPQNDSIESLRSAHGELEARLNQLDRHRSLSPEERFEMQVLKKRKLAIKDRIRSMSKG
jgi:hypothetical protein